MENQTPFVIKQVTDAWYLQVQRTDKLFASLSDEQLQKEVSPGRNRGIYLLGHLVAVHDRMLPLLFGIERLYPELDADFVEAPDKTRDLTISVTELKTAWSRANAVLAEHFNKLQPSGWLEKHTAVSEADFVREPHRNRLNVILSRTNHLSSHYGQLLFLKN
jgi:hypothetical protein